MLVTNAQHFCDYLPLVAFCSQSANGRGLRAMFLDEAISVERSRKYFLRRAYFRRKYFLLSLLAHCHLLVMLTYAPSV